MKITRKDVYEYFGEHHNTVWMHVETGMVDTLCGWACSLIDSGDSLESLSDALYRVRKNSDGDYIEVE